MQCLNREEQFVFFSIHVPIKPKKGAKKCSIFFKDHEDMRTIIVIVKLNLDLDVLFLTI